MTSSLGNTLAQRLVSFWRLGTHELQIGRLGKPNLSTLTTRFLDLDTRRAILTAHLFLKRDIWISETSLL